MENILLSKTNNTYRRDTTREFVMIWKKGGASTCISYSLEIGLCHLGNNCFFVGFPSVEIFFIAKASEVAT